MAADDDEVGRLESLPEQLHRDRAAGLDDLRVLVDRDEAVGAAERGDRARALAHRIGGEVRRRSLHQADQQVFGSAALGVHAHRQRRRHASAGAPAAGRRGAHHRRDELVEREDRRGRKARQDDDRLAAGDREADRLAGLRARRRARRCRDRASRRRRGTTGRPPPWTCRRRSTTSRTASASCQRRRRARRRRRDDAELHGLAAQLVDGGAEDRGVRVVDRAERQRRAGRDDLVAGREDRDPRSPIDVMRRRADRRQHADLARRQQLPGAQHRLARAMSVPAKLTLSPAATARATR